MPDSQPDTVEKLKRINAWLEPVFRSLPKPKRNNSRNSKETLLSDDIITRYFTQNLPPGVECRSCFLNDYRENKIYYHKIFRPEAQDRFIAVIGLKRQWLQNLDLLDVLCTFLFKEGCVACTCFLDTGEYNGAAYWYVKAFAQALDKQLQPKTFKNFQDLDCRDMDEERREELRDWLSLGLLCAPDAPVTISGLKEVLTNHFDEIELRLLCSDVEARIGKNGVHLKLEDVGGENHPSKVLNLIEWSERRGYLCHLEQAAHDRVLGSNGRQ